MNAATAKRWIILAMVGAAASTTVTSISQGDGLPSVRTVIGATIAGLMLTALADVQPEIAGGLAAIALLVVVLDGLPWERIASFLD